MAMSVSTDSSRCDCISTDISTEAEMSETDIMECRRCRDDNEPWPCFGCSDWYCVDCLGREMQVIDQDQTTRRGAP